MVTTPRVDEYRLGRPMRRLDPSSPDLHRDAAVLRGAGPLVPVELPGGVTAWAVTRDAAARRILADTDTFSVERRHWRALRDGEIPPDWPLMGLANPQGRSLITTDGADHQALRGPLARVFTERRIRALGPFIEAATASLLDDMGAAADAAPGESVDFRELVAWPLPMRVISDLLGVPEEDRRPLRDAFDVLFDDTRDPAAAIGTIQGCLVRLVEEKRRNPSDDLISDLMRLPADQQLTEEELIAGIQVLIIAGHETTVHLLVNGVRTLDAHPDQLALLQSGEVSWAQCVEEILRYEPPVANFLFRLAVRDTTVAGVPVAAGDPIVISYISFGRDAERYGPNAHQFDIRRAQRGHTSFGHGPHFCIGAPLARLEGRTVLQELYARWPDLSVAGPVERAPSALMNAYSRLPVRLSAGA